MARRESPVNIGDKVYVVDTNKFEVVEATVQSNPGDHIYVLRKGRKAPEFVGPMRYSTRYADAVEQAKVLIKERRTALNAEVEALTKQLAALK